MRLELEDITLGGGDFLQVADLLGDVGDPLLDSGLGSGFQRQVKADLSVGMVSVRQSFGKTGSALGHADPALVLPFPLPRLFGAGIKRHLADQADVVIGDLRPVAAVVLVDVGADPATIFRSMLNLLFSG